ncbi:MAG: hypothetical protein EYC62_03085 [Alphaproteobacteria bacterium]|nr:MAG: hypothetical protein EYC62_03085 [Alphaproteobacteria bacterium]
MIGNIFSAFGKTLGWIFNILMLPLSIYALMQIMGWDWVKSGVAALILTAVPVIGSIGNLLLAFIGIYFVTMNWPHLF